MAIPSPETSFVNWHFVDTFIGGRANFRLAGINFPDTSALLGSSGVRECGETLRRLGADLPPDQSFYAANRDHTFLDMLLGNLQSGRRPDHLRIDDCCDSEPEARPCASRPHPCARDFRTRFSCAGWTNGLPCNDVLVKHHRGEFTTENVVRLRGMTANMNELEARFRPAFEEDDLFRPQSELLPALILEMQEALG